MSELKEYERESHLCVLCSKTAIHNELQQLDSLTCDMMKIIHTECPKSTLTLMNGLYICKDCDEKLNKSFSFKTCCLEIDDYLQTYLNDENKVDMELALSGFKENGFNKQDVKQTCRLCLDTVVDSRTFTLDKQELIQVMMEACLPEVDMQIIDHSTFCNVCIQHLTAQHNCIQSLTKLEEKLLKSHASISNKESCDLSQVKDLKCNENISNETTKEICDNVHADKGAKQATTITKNNNKRKHNVTKAKEESSVITYKRIKPKEQKSAINVEDDVAVICHKCSKCSFTSIHNNSVKLHSLLSHSDVDTLISTKISNGVKWYICNFCQYEVDRIYNIWSHVILHEDEEKISQKKTCHSQKKASQAKDVPMILYQCMLCSYKSDKLAGVNRHLKKHATLNSKIHLCKTCTYKTNCKNTVNQHMLSCKEVEEVNIEGVVAQFKCQFCDFRGTDEQQFLKHAKHCWESNVDKQRLHFYKVVDIMTQVQPVPALTRISIATNAVNNKRKPNVTKDKEESSVITDKGIKPQEQKSAIKVEQDVVIAEEVIYHKCSTCSFTSINDNSIKLHTLLSHSDVDTLISTKTSNGVKWYICNYCQFQVDRVYNIWSHLILHENEAKSSRKKACRSRKKASQARTNDSLPKLNSLA